MSRIAAILLSLTMAFMVMAGQIVQYHHHDENDEICLCLDPTHHCHDDHHDDCNHDSDDGCSLHFEDSIIVDANDNSILVAANSAVEVLSDITFLQPESKLSTYYAPDLILYVSVHNDSHSLRAPPVV